MAFTTNLLYKIPSKFPESLLDSMVDYVKELHYNDGTVAGDHKTKSRSSQVAWIPWDEWIPGIIHNMMTVANKAYFKYDLDYFQTQIQSTMYSGKTKDFYTWHVDNDNNSIVGNRERKLSCSLLLSDPDEYRGGEFQIHYERHCFESFRPQKGDCLIFPAWVPHRVRPVTEGTRISLVSWMNGPMFK
jgi:PKHD-type hydroxylase